MYPNEFTSYIDAAQVALYVFWLFFFGLVFWLRREDRREGYPLESDPTGKVKDRGFLLLPSPKTFLLRDGTTATAPNFKRELHYSRRLNGVAKDSGCFSFGSIDSVVAG